MDLLVNLRNFNKSYALRKELLLIMVNCMHEEDLYCINKTFNEIDKDNSGAISLHEMVQTLQSYED